MIYRLGTLTGDFYEVYDHLIIIFSVFKILEQLSKFDTIMLIFVYTFYTYLAFNYPFTDLQPYI